jgi:ATP-dependent RNA helicase DDX27
MSVDDDIIFTLSDHSPSDLSSDDEPSQSISKPSTTTNGKRKRTEAGKAKSKKKQKIQQQAEESDGESEEEGVKDDALDPEFEFDIGANSYEAVEEFDGWGDDGMKTVKGGKRGVDLDEIIGRKMGKKEGIVSKPAEDEVQVEDGSDIEDADEAVLEEEDDDGDVAIDFDDDELIADDAFGVNGVDAEPEERSQEQHVNEGQEDSDDESAASPTAHPDDMDESDKSDAESQTSTSDAEEAAKRAAFFASEQPATVPSRNGNSFQQFALSRPILRGLSTLSFTAPTPIQQRAIPIALQGLDVVGSAVTGSGKTAAFLLPILERLLYRPRKVPTTRVAILMPTRELAVQCHNVATALARFTDVTFAMLVGGFNLREQEAILKKRPDVVIATPGRFIDHMRNSASFTVETIEILVLDEADRMLETGFEDELDEILKTIPRSRQTMLFSATMTETVDKLVRVGMNRPVRLSVDAKKATTTGLTQEFVRLRPGREDKRLATLCVLCTKAFTERTIIFFRQKKDAHRVRILFGLLGLKAGELHGSMSQEQRFQAVNSFRDGKTTHLLATDLASRGLDIKNIMTVINYEAPQTHEIYVHRVGRTARAGRSGRACTIAAEPDRKVVKAAVKSGRAQGAKIVSRVMEVAEVDTMDKQIGELASDIDDILREEKEEKELAQTEQQITRGENLVKHEDEIKARPKRTWFETEKEKTDAKKRGVMELNGIELKIKGERKKLSNKDKKRLDAKKERKERGGMMGKKALLKQRDDFVKRKAKNKKKKSKGKSGKAK